MGLVFFLLSLSSAPPPSDGPVFKLTVDSHDLYSLLGCADILARRSYARLVYDRELHDSLLRRVLAAEPRQDGYTLLNTLAQKQATDLLASANDYF